MRTAKALLASLPLAALLVAAVVVPIALAPGAFRFQDWPSPAQPRGGVERIGLGAPLATAPAQHGARTRVARTEHRSAAPTLAMRPQSRPAVPRRVAAPSRPMLADTAPGVRQPRPAAPAPPSSQGSAPATPAATAQPEPAVSQASAPAPACGRDGCNRGPGSGAFALARRTVCQAAGCTR